MSYSMRMVAVGWCGALLLGSNLFGAMAAGQQQAGSGTTASPSRKTTGDPYFTPSLHSESALNRPDTPAPPLGSPGKTEGRTAAPASQTTSAPPRDGEFAPPTGGGRGSIIRGAAADETPAPRTGPMEQQPYIPSKSEGTAPEMERVASTDTVPSGARAFELGQVVAVVGGEPIYVGDLYYEASVLIEKAMPTAPAAAKDQQRIGLMKMLIPKLVDSKLLYVSTIRGLPDGVKVEDVLEQAAKEFDENALPELIRKSGVNTAAMFDANLRLMGHSLRKMRETWSREQLTRYFLSQQLEIESDVTHREMLEHYQANLDKYAIPARAQWEQVMVRFDRFSNRNEARKAIVEMGNQIVYGAQLEAVAKRSSHGFRAGSGGQQGWINKGELALTELDEAIFSLPVGELSDIIETRDGLHIIRIQDRQEATRTPFLEAQVEIREAIENEKREAAFQKHLEKLRTEIPVEIYSEVLGETEPKRESLDSPRAMPATGSKGQ